MLATLMKMMLDIFKTKKLKIMEISRELTVESNIKILIWTI